MKTLSKKECQIISGGMWQLSRARGNPPFPGAVPAGGGTIPASAGTIGTTTSGGITSVVTQGSNPKTYDVSNWK